jgi:hypothetical protein
LIEELLLLMKCSASRGLKKPKVEGMRSVGGEIEGKTQKSTKPNTPFTPAATVRLLLYSERG